MSDIVNRRDAMLLGLAGAALPALGGPASAASLTTVPKDWSARDFLMTWAKLQGDLSGRTVYAYTEGAVWGFLPQADDVTLDQFYRRAYMYRNLQARQVKANADGTISVKRTIWSFYLDPDTGGFIDSYRNSWTGKTVEVPQLYYPPRIEVVGEKGTTTDKIPDPSTGLSKEDPNRVKKMPELSKPDHPYDMRIYSIEDRCFISTASFSRLSPGGISWWKLEGSLQNHVCSTRDLHNKALTHIPNSWDTNTICEWQTWLEMHGHPGSMLFKGNGVILSGAKAVPADFLAEIERRRPGTFAETLMWGGK